VQQGAKDCSFFNNLFIPTEVNCTGFIFGKGLPRTRTSLTVLVSFVKTERNLSSGTLALTLESVRDALCLSGAT